MMNDPTSKISMSQKLAIAYGLKSGKNKVVILLKKGATIPCLSVKIGFVIVMAIPNLLKYMFINVRKIKKKKFWI